MLSKSWTLSVSCPSVVWVLSGKMSRRRMVIRATFELHEFHEKETYHRNRISVQLWSTYSLRVLSHSSKAISMSIQTRRKCWKAWNETEIEREFCTVNKPWKINYDLYTGRWCIHLISYFSTSLRMSRRRRTCTVVRSQHILEGLWYFLPAMRNKLSIFLSTIASALSAVFTLDRKGPWIDGYQDTVVLTLLPIECQKPVNNVAASS